VRQHIINRSKISQKDACGCCVWIFEPTNPQSIINQIFIALSERYPPEKRKNILLTRQSGKQPPTAAAE